MYKFLMRTVKETLGKRSLEYYKWRYLKF
jgi:hypothetical protein